ncbi:MAG: GAF domain-containing protein, partial [Pontiellaceae bacterium]|nr:GAF domain-containing protein [Pontiellaceae bacterium]
MVKNSVIADVCSQLQTSGTIRELCQSALRLIQERLQYERVSIFLKEAPADSGEPFYGFYRADQPVETKDHLARLMNGIRTGDRTTILDKKANVLDFDGTVPGQADRLCVPLVAKGEELGWLIADNFPDKAGWKRASIEIFQILSVFLAGTLLNKKEAAQQMTEDRDELIREKETAKQRATFINNIFDHLEDRIYFKDRQSRVLGGNKAWLKAKKAGAIDELLGKTDLNFYSAPLGQQLYDREQKQMATGEVTRIC